MARIAFLLLLAGGLSAQTVDGTLTDSMSHAPIPDVIVTLLGPARYNGTTDEAGVFHIGLVKPGKYTLNIVKAGYVLPPARRDPFQVDSDTRLSVEMDPLGTIRGKVRYPDGRPAPRAELSATMRPSNRTFTATADIGGSFLVEDLQPGSYVLRAIAAPGDPKAEGEIWAPTWFPSTTDPNAAEPIAVQTGVTAAHDIRLRSVPARRLRGVVRDETGRPAPGVTVSVTSGDEQTVVTGEDGAFDLLVRDGEWRLSAIRKDGEVERKAAMTVTVSRHDVENADLRLAVPFSIPVILDGDPPPKGMPGMVLVYLMPVEGPFLPRPTMLDQQKSTTMPNVYPGRYLIHAAGRMAGAYVESIKLGDVETFGRPVAIWDGSLPIRIAFRRGGPVLRGTIEKGAGAAVLVINQDETLVSDNVANVVVTPDGRFEITDLRPGDYYVLAFDHSEPLVMANPAFWRPLLTGAERVQLKKGEASAVTLKLTPWPK
jgi:hypothetical protein